MIPTLPPHNLARQTTRFSAVEYSPTRSKEEAQQLVFNQLIGDCIAIVSGTNQDAKAVFSNNLLKFIQQYNVTTAEIDFDQLNVDSVTNQDESNLFFKALFGKLVNNDISQAALDTEDSVTEYIEVQVLPKLEKPIILVIKHADTLKTGILKNEFVRMIHIFQDIKVHGEAKGWRNLKWLLLLEGQTTRGLTPTEGKFRLYSPTVQIN